MPPLAVALVLVAAVLHAGWNVLLKTSGDPLRTAVRLQAIGAAVLVPFGFVAWLAKGSPALDPAGVGLALVSGVLEAAYFVFLSAAYGRGDLSLVYPLARGSAPLLSIVVGLGFLGERLSGPAMVGVASLLTGIMLVARPWRAVRVAGRHHRGAIGFALLTGAMIAAYSTVDRLGVRLMEPWLYGALLAVFATTMLTTVVALGRRTGIIATRPAPIHPTPLWRDGVAGVISLSAYLLILFAYALAPLAAVAPLRESGIVLAAAWGALRLGEATGRRQAGARIAAAALVVLGAVLLAVFD
ncbi:MAG: EamA family transporter [Chloroflexi bacterium]|nr:EamA family transporter [Chloroflexota bacterium]